MKAQFLVPETEARAQGAGEVVLCGSAENAIVTLGVVQVEEQQSLQVLVWGSQDGADWGQKPRLQFGEKFYPGIHEMLLEPVAPYLQVRWHVNRWGRGDLTPRFLFYVFLRPLVS